MYKDNKDTYVFDGPVLKDIVDVALVVDGDEETPRPPEEHPVLLAGQPDGGSVDYWHQLFQVVLQQSEKQTLVPVLEIESRD